VITGKVPYVRSSVNVDDEGNQEDTPRQRNVIAVLDGLRHKLPIINARLRLGLADTQLKMLADELVDVTLSAPFAYHYGRRGVPNTPGSLYGRPLTPNETRVIIGVAHGFQSREISTRMGVSEHTVKTHLRRAYEKLGARNAASAVTIALKVGVMTLDQVTLDVPEL